MLSCHCWASCIPSASSGFEFKFSNTSDSIVGRIIPSFRIATEMEKRKWKEFREALVKKDRKNFYEMLSYSRLYNSAGVMSCKTVIIKPILMSIIFEYYKLLTRISSENAN